MPDSEVIQSKKLEVSSAILIAGLSGALTLAGVMSSSVIGAISTKQSAELTAQSAKLSADLAAQSARISAQQACVARLDTQEQSLRSKADQYLSALGDFIALTGHPKFVQETYDARLDGLMKSGYSFSAYAPKRLATLSRNTVIELKKAIHDADDTELEAALDAFNKTNQEWNEEFQKFLKELASMRKDC
ncbi:hypothetical protein WCL09_17545 [Pseudomonas koreensis]|uniref:hypothetical protein n=1 Tax=Pseudomonas koreensis TaxID=198620 RepID=UPI00301A91D6